MKTYLLFAFIFIYSFGFSQDLLVLKNGKILKVKILEVKSDEVKFLKEEIKDSPPYFEKKSEICYIQYPTFRDTLSGCSSVLNNYGSDNSSTITQPTKQTSTAEPVAIKTTPPPPTKTVNTAGPFTYFKLINDFVLKTKIKQTNDYNYHIDVYDENNKFMYETILLSSNVKEKQGEDGRLSQLYSALYDEYKDEIISVTKSDGLILNFILFSQDDDLVWYTLLGETKKIYMLKKNIASTTSKIISFKKGLYTPPSFSENSKISIKTTAGNQYDVIYIRETADDFYVKQPGSSYTILQAKSTIKEINGVPYDYTPTIKPPVSEPPKTVSQPIITQPKVEDPATSGTIYFIDIQRTEVEAIDIEADDDEDIIKYRIKGQSVTTAISRNEVFFIKYKNGVKKIITKQ